MCDEGERAFKTIQQGGHLMSRSWKPIFCTALLLPVLGVLAPNSAEAYTYRPMVMGTHGVVSSGSPVVSLVAIDVLKKGGNAADAGVAALFAAMVVEHTHHSLGGESPILYYSAKDKKVYHINGIGPAPKLATWEYFDKMGFIPNEDSFLIAPVPGTLDGAVLTLDKFGTLKLADTMQPAIDLAEKGHPISKIMVKWIKNAKAILSKWPGSVKVFLPGGNPPETGDMFYQPEYAQVLKKIRDGETKNLKKGRSKAMQAARDVFYKGEIAHALDKFSRENDGLIRYEDLAGYRGKIEEPWKTTYKNYEVYSTSSVSQGPMLLQAMNLLEPYDFTNMKHNSPEYMHLVVEAFKLAYMDRHNFYGDPDKVKVPYKGLMSKAYADERRKLIDPTKAAMEMPVGDPWKYEGSAGRPADTGPVLARASTVEDDPEFRTDTTAIVIIDKDGNMFSTTCSNNMGVRRSGVTPTGLGFVLSGRLRQFSLDPKNPNVIAGGKIPRITPTPQLALKDGKPFMAWTTPGEDVQTQANLQVFFNVVHFGMDLQTAVEVPRFRSLHGPEPHFPQDMKPGQVRAEPRIAPETVKAMEALGHKIKTENDWAEPSGGMVIVVRDDKTGVLSAGADPRRDCYAIGW
jgi:gamma-glutamyltranspeptidase / glutathione hydrolase